ncbi:hypothetical protein BC834DRAFT_879535 [Gloeopeniophorella convolvens]|nr:hypothetical protein BC834DRAFT_879535 [Gloeopeniophorella convolvens]
MSLVFSLAAALAATIVQQWVRDYMHVFQRYGHPLKSARIRQFPYEGAQNWYMPVVAEAVPALIHISLFLFFIGLADFTFSVNTTVGATTVTPILVCALLYIWSVFAPVMNPQSPYQSSFSGLFWYLFRGHTRRSRTFGTTDKTISANMEDGRMQLAMDISEGRKGRDARAIRWLIGNLTEDSEMEPFVMSIPGSFATEWGREVWGKVSEIEDENLQELLDESDVTTATRPDGGASESTSSVPTSLRRHRRYPSHQSLPLPVQQTRDIVDLSSLPSAHRERLLRSLCARIGRQLRTCLNPGLLTLGDTRRKRARACIETATWLVFHASGQWEWFGDLKVMAQVLSYVGETEKIREAPTSAFDQSFVMQWTCMSLVVVRKMLGSPMTFQVATPFINALANAYDDAIGETDDRALTNARRIDECIKATWDHVRGLRRALSVDGELVATDEEVQQALSSQRPQIEELKRTKPEDARLERIDSEISLLFSVMDNVTNGIIQHIPGTALERSDEAPALRLLLNSLFSDQPRLNLQMIRPGKLILGMSSFVPSLRAAMGSGSSRGYRETLDVLQAVGDISGDVRKVLEQRRPIPEQKRLVELQLWRMQDLRGGGLGYTVELFFLALKQLLRTSTSQDRTHPAFHIGTFKAITSDWEQCKNALGTQHVLLNLLCDIAVPSRGIFSYDYPEYVVDELLSLSRNVFEGQSGSHIGAAVQELGKISWEDDYTLKLKIRSVLSP